MPSSITVEPGAVAAPIASWRHTARMVAIFAALSASGLLIRSGSAGAVATAGPRPSHAPLYASLIVAEWLLFRGIKAGLTASGGGWRTLLGRAGSSARAVAADVVLGLLLCSVWVTAVLVVGSAAGQQAARSPLLPRGVLEIALWVLLSLSAAFCEEIAFRGYFQRQFEALTRRPGLALVMQAVLFGIAHAYQGASSALAISGYGLLFGALALWRRSLRPGIIAHALTDIILGLGLR